MNKKNPFYGIGKVFSFTLKQNMGSKAYKGITLGVGALFIIAMIIVNVMIAKSDAPSPIEKVYVLCDSGIAKMDIDQMIKNVSSDADKFEDTSFENVKDGTTKNRLIEMVGESNENAAGAYISMEDNTFNVNVYVRKDGVVSEDDGDKLADVIAECVQSAKVMNVELTTEQLVTLCTPIEVNDKVIGEETSVGKTLVKMFAPMIFSLILYMMLIFYGQTISKNVVSEKSSKLMEYILTSTRPYALIAGKIMAMATSAIAQFTFWCVCAVGGYLAGDKVAKSINPDYNNALLDVIKALKDEAAGAFSWQAVIGAFIMLCIGFLFYCVIAGLVSSFSQKTEDLQQLMIIYQYTVIIGFFVAYFGSVMEKKSLDLIGKYVPFCSPFSLPANILIGGLTPMEMILSISILVVTTVLFILLTGRVYSAMVLYNGAKLNPKLIKNVILGRK